MTVAFSLSSKDFEVIEIIQRKHYVGIADTLFHSHAHLVARIEARLNEFERKLEIEED